MKEQVNSNTDSWRRRIEMPIKDDNMNLDFSSPFHKDPLS